MTALRFAGAGYVPPAGGAVALRFGAALGGDDGPVFEDLGAGVGSGVTAPWGPAGSAHRPVHCGTAAALIALAAGQRSTWGPAAPVNTHVALPWGFSQAIGVGSVRTPWGLTLQVGAGTVRLPWGSTLPVGASLLRTLWGPGDASHAGLRNPWAVPLPVHLSRLAPWGWPVPLWLAVEMAAGAAVPGWWHRVLPWGGGLPVWSVGAPLDPVPIAPYLGCYVPPDGAAVALRFSDVLTAVAVLRFMCRRQATATVPIREVYMITNVTALTRVSDGATIQATTMSLSLDVDSWAWGFSATCPADQLALIEPAALGEPIELQATVNGTNIRVFVESISRERTHGQSSVRIQGRGKTAVLDAPFYPESAYRNVSARTSQQLAEEALPAGWALEWGPDPWLVPPGVWSHLGTPISAINTIATAAGAYVQPHGTANTLKVLPRYPLPPWQWAGATPDLQLPSAVLQREYINWTERARYNAVYVSGTVNGVLGHVTRAGTAGDLLAPMVSDALITHADAARQRGLVALADGGRQARVGLRLFVLPETGIVVPGKLIRYIDGAATRVGLSRSVQVSVAGHEVWQTVEVETHVA